MFFYYNLISLWENNITKNEMIFEGSNCKKGWNKM
jgi:hypothetical protein